MRSTHRRPVVEQVDPAEVLARSRGDRGFGAMVRQLRDAGRVPLADVARIVPGTTEAMLLEIEAGKRRASIDLVRAYSMCTAATFTMLFDVWDREGDCAADRMTVAEATSMVQRLMETPDGVLCPCCGGKVVARKRTINEPVASFVAWLVRSFVGEPLSANRWADRYPKIARGGTYARARHWGLAVRSPGRDPLWAPTESGKRWARGISGVHRHAVLWRGKVLRFEGGLVKINEVASGEEIQRGLGPTPSLPGLV